MVIGWTESVLGDGPPRRKNDKIRNGHTGTDRRASKDGKDGRILVNNPKIYSKSDLLEKCRAKLTQWSNSTELMTIKSARLYL